MDDVRSQIRAFLARHVRRDDLTDDANIFQGGYVNSLFAMELVLFVERDFKIAIGDDDLSLENFQSVNAIAALVARKRAAI